MKGKLLLFAALMMIVISFGVFAATSTNVILTPTSSSFISGTITLRTEVNGTNYTHWVSGMPSTANLTNVSWESSNDSGATWLVVGSNNSNVNNGTLSNWTFSYKTNALADVTSLRWRSRGFNGTNGNNTIFTSATITSVTVDNTLPTNAFTQSENIRLTSGSISNTVVNASSCTIKFSDSQIYSMTRSGDTCSYTLTKAVIPDGTYSIVVTGNDGTNTTSRSRSFTIALHDDEVIQNPSTTAAQQAAAQGKSKTPLIVIAAVLGYFLLTSKGGKKK